MKQLRTSETTMFFNTRDELVRLKLDKVAYFEADSNYCHVVMVNGAHATLLTSLVNIEKLLSENFSDESSSFIRIGKRYIVNRRYIFQINIPRQRLILTDYESPNILEIAISKEALRNLKQLYTKS